MSNFSSNIKYASFYQRLLAHNIDLIPILGLFYLTTLLINSKFDIIIMGSIYIFYNISFELSSLKATPGKKWNKISIENDSSRSKVLNVILRNFLKPLSLILFFLGFVMMLFNSKRQGLHDYIAGTIVLFNK
ncbi:MAG: RDD family protein [Ekhidna sp.]|nr:RDD family protein [Ekhidna sp.]MBC6410323.1 RDD family protein [Ekhidna sp.]MBC6425425.1 RDD family protein [Ekhidna sp.]